MEQTIRRYRSDHDLSQCGRVEAGSYISRWYRGLSAGMEWLRLSLDGAAEATVRVYASDAEPEAWSAGLEPALERTAADLLLYGVTGRYLCFTVTPAQGLRGYELTFPGLSIDRLLPAVLQNDGALRKLLGVYQSLYMDANRDAAAFPRRLDPLGADPLPCLRLWLGAARWIRGGLPAGKLLAAAPRLNRLRGTRKGLDLLLELAAGCPCTVVEGIQWSTRTQSAREREECARLYGGASGGVTLLIPAHVPEDTVRDLNEILDDFIPLGVPYTVVHLRNGAPVDEHSYLDDNAQILELPAPRMDGGDYDALILE